jgi:group I intron endonuclease
MIGIYKITSPNNKVYIGQSINIEKRLQQYKRLDCKGQRRLYNSLKKHGHEKHKFEVICSCNREDLNTLEKYYIDIYKTFNTKIGLNLREGGGANGKLSSSTRELMRLNMIGNKRNFGKPLSDKTKLKISMANKGKRGTRLGVKTSEETKLKQSIAAKKRGIPRKTIELSALKTGKAFKAINNMGITESFTSISYMSKKYNIGRGTIRKTLNNKYTIHSKKLLKGWHSFIYIDKNNEI